MNIAILLALGAMVSGALSDLIYKGAQTRGINPTTFIFYQSITFAITIWAVAIATGQVHKITTPAWVFGPPIGLLSYMGILLFVMSLKEENASINVPIFRLSFVITSMGAIIVLHEPVTLMKVVGMLLAVVGILSLADLTALRATHTSTHRSMLYLLAAMLAFGIAGVLNKEATNQGSLTIPLILVTTLAFQGAALARALITRQIKPNTTTIRLAPLVGVLQLTWAVMLIQSLQTTDASISFPIVQLSFVLTAILAVVIFKEMVTRGLVIGLLAATLAVVAFAFV